MSTMRQGGFDDRLGQPLEATRRGAHRARPALFATLLPALAVVTVVGVAVALTWTLFGGRLPGGDGDSTVVGAGSPSPSASASTSASASPSASVTPAPTPTPTPTPTPSDTVDRSATVNVLNNTSTSGLARKAGTALKADGWTIGEIGDFLPRNTLDATTVFYASAGDAATAQAVADDLGAGNGGIEESAENAKNGDITVVLGPDYEP